MTVNRSSSDRTWVRFGIVGHTDPVNALRIIMGAILMAALAACAPMSASADVASVASAPIATAIPSQTATPDIRPQMTDAAASLQLTNDAAYLAASNATQSAGWTAVSVNATSNAIVLQGTEVQATQQSISKTQTQEPKDEAARATATVQAQINATATGLAENADSEAIRANRVEQQQKVDTGWAFFLIGLMILVGIAAVCVVYYIWRGTENKAESVAAITRAQAKAISDKTAAEIELMKDRDKLSARLRARIQEVGDRAAERMADVKAVKPEATAIVQEPSAEGIEPGTYNATTELVLRTLTKAASIAPLGWDDPVIPPQGLAWGGNGTRQKVVDILVERGLVRTRSGQGAEKGTRVQEYGSIGGLYHAILDGQVVIYDDHPTPLEVTAEAWEKQP